MTDKKNHGGFAFPRPIGEARVGDNRIEFNDPQKGMTLRDYFAAQALTNLNIHEDFSKVAEIAYKVADAMLEERKTMKPCLIEATTIQDAYFQMLYKVMDIGVKYEITEGSMRGDFRYEFPYAAGFINYPHVKPLAPIMPNGIAPTTTDENIDDYFANYIMDPNLTPGEEYRYSQWINGEFENPYKFDRVHQVGCFESQLRWCINHLEKKGYGNAHCYITVGDPQVNFRYDAPYKDETERRTSPCLRGIDIKVKEGKVVLGVVFRSWDLYGGFPQNMGGFALLNQYIANELGIEPGPLTYASCGLHIYGSQVKPVLAAIHKE